MKEKKIAIPITRIEYYNEEGELVAYSDEQLPMYSDITDLRGWSEEDSSIEIVYERVSDAWIIRVTPRVEKKALYALAKEEVKKKLLAQSNRIGKKWEEDGLTWYG